MYSGDSMLKGMEKDIPPHPCRQCEIKGSAQGFKITLKLAHFLHSLYALKLYSIFFWNSP